MSLMGPVVSFYVLCCLLAVSLQPSDTSPVCKECSNNSTGQNSSETAQRNVTESSSPVNSTNLNQLFNRSRNRQFNHTVNDANQDVTEKVNATSFSHFDFSTTQKPLLQPSAPPAKNSDSTSGPEVTDARLSLNNNTGLNKTAGVPSNTLGVQAIIPPNTSTTLQTSTLKTTPTPTHLSTTKTAPSHSPKTTAPAPDNVMTTPFSKTTTTTKEPATITSTTATVTTTTSTTTATASTSTTTTTTTTATATSAAAASTKSTDFVSTSSAPTVQYLSPVVEVATSDLTRQLVDTASLLAILLFGLLFLFVVVAVFLTQAYESYKRKDYTQVDYLINGMYTDSGV
ncbi:hypothetical protein NL108_003258 [Boleophthalmus pectinirostris]|uniref:uncharacterized protein C11orf24 n=1 Tax=Boleophthalmus pectinirostris TaxID=150288 RepID=UPI00242DB223|nr:uncharacterized protein C11orf24 [Boleophthalmus pectinirostris]KAJ0047287.1 hypothetical protein NL108_003258 [Boleophthalmus pectinirostris]